MSSNLSGATAAMDPVQFYGYYTLDFERDGTMVGMLSVNGFSGQVFLHAWHGTFIEEQTPSPSKKFPSPFSHFENGEGSGVGLPR